MLFKNADVIKAVPKIQIAEFYSNVNMSVNARILINVNECVI